MLSVGGDRSRNRSKSPGRRAESPPKSKSGRSKKHYEPSSSDSEAVTESDSEDDRRASRRKKGDKDRRRRSDESSDEDDKRRSKDSKYERDSKYDRPSKDGRHASYSEAGRYEYSQMPELSRHLSYPDRGQEPPGAYREYADREHATRHMSYVEANNSGGGRYQNAPVYEYAQPSQNIKYVSKTDPRRAADEGKRYYTQTAHPQIEAERKLVRRESDDRHKKSRKDSDEEKKSVRRELERRESERSKHRSSRRDDDSDSDSDSEHDRRKSSKSKSKHRDSDSDDRRKKEKDKDRHRGSTSHDQRPQVIEVKPGQRGLMAADPSGRMHRLSISGGGPGSMALVAPGQHMMMGGGLPPGSPLLEAYHGTYQSISPMPSPMHMPGGMDDDLSDLEQLGRRGGSSSSSDSDDHHSRKTSLKKRVEIYDPEHDALAIAAELKQTKPTGKELIKILPQLSDDNMMHLRTEYKKHFKVNGKGINVAKHIKLKLKDQGNIGKVAYATALGRWESEAYWANFWYQSGTSRRELLIESLIGRSNGEIGKIKEAFSDKRYNDSLDKCMQAELKKDKFRNAILLALQQKRQDDLAPLSKSLIAEDVRDLYKALVSKDGGETAMIEIIVVRSDLHLRQVLKAFEQKYERNFAREMIQKSQNLVGEVLAHILNGVLNKPMRDAQLLHQALSESTKDRAELLISRLVRYHWEPKHLERVKISYKQKYGVKLEHDIESGTKGDFGAFCLALTQGAKR